MGQGLLPGLSRERGPSSAQNIRAHSGGNRRCSSDRRTVRVHAASLQSATFARQFRRCPMRGIYPRTLLDFAENG